MVERSVSFVQSIVVVLVPFLVEYVTNGSCELLLIMHSSTPKRVQMNHGKYVTCVRQIVPSIFSLFYQLRIQNRYQTPMMSKMHRKQYHRFVEDVDIL